MRLIVDTNILVRCVRGRAFQRASALVRRDVSLCVTHHNVEEMFDVLVRKCGMAESEALIAGTRILRPFEVIDLQVYGDWRGIAASRLREGGQSDWPSLAAAIALDCAIWSEDVDYFGTGVAVWSSRNVLECTTEKE